MKPVDIEGYTPDELLALPDDQFAPFVFCGRPLAFRAGTAEILGEFRLVSDSLVIELAHIDGGGEGVLPTLWRLAERYAGKQGIGQIEWIVHAIHCARPNLKLRRVLERKGFVVAEIAGVGPAYHFVQRPKRDEE